MKRCFIGKTFQQAMTHHVPQAVIFPWVHSTPDISFNTAYFSVSQPVGHSAVFERATGLRQKYVRLQLYKHPVTAAWKHIVFSSKIITDELHIGMNSQH